MKKPITLDQLAAAIKNSSVADDLKLSTQIIAGEVAVLQVSIENREEIPVYITIDDSQILCVTYLWQEQEINPDKREALLDSLLTLNIPMPLSSFSKLGKQYIIFGAMSIYSSAEDVAHEIEALSDNTLDALELMVDYLN